MVWAWGGEVGALGAVLGCRGDMGAVRCYGVGVAAECRRWFGGCLGARVAEDIWGCRECVEDLGVQEGLGLWWGMFGGADTPPPFCPSQLRDCELSPGVNRDLTRRVRNVSGITQHRPIVRNDIKLAARLVHALDGRAQLWGAPTPTPGGGAALGGGDAPPNPDGDGDPAAAAAAAAAGVSGVLGVGRRRVL